jgi:NADPH-dependent 2,4-dienoyl-CoA reductase/sulfur reductase-like enzyme
MDMQTIVIAGGACAGLSAARELRKQGFAGGIRVIDRDVDGAYRRPEVSKGLLDGSHEPATIATPWPDSLAVDLTLGVDLVALHSASREVEVRHPSGAVERIGYDGLVIATGCDGRLSPFGAGVGRVHTLRTVADSVAMRPHLDQARDVVIIGGGFIGLEVASVAGKLGKNVTVVEALDIPLARVLGDDFGRRIAAMHRGHGVDLRTGATVSELVTDPHGDVSEVVLGTGERLAADIVLVAVGSMPGVGWLESSGLALDQGIECDETCAVVGVDGVVAAGDVANWVNPLYGRRMRVEHWTNAIEQGTYAARRLLGVHDPAGFSSAPYFWSDQWGVKIQSVGSTFDHDRAEILSEGDDHLLVAYLREERVVAVAGYNTGAMVMKTRRLVLASADLAELRELTLVSPTS